MSGAVKAQVRSGRAPIVQAAIANFERRGFHGTSMRDVARDADVTVAAIYHHFSSKQQVLLEIMTTVLTDSLAATREAVALAGDCPRAQLDALMRVWVVFHGKRQPEALIGASEIRSLDEHTRPVVVDLRDQQEELFRQVLDRGVSTGDFATTVLRERVRALIAMGTSVATWYRPGSGLTPEELAERYVEVAHATVGLQS